MADGGSFDTFPKLLLRNATQFGTRPAFRHKDLGIWQTWTWAQVAAIVRAYAAGLHRLGLQPGDKIAVVGSNRPKLYWTMMAAQALQAIPVPVYSDAVAEELAFVLAHAEASFVAAQDQEQVDKVLSVCERVPHLQKILYDESRGLDGYADSRLIAIHDVIEDGRAALTADPALCGQIDEFVRQGDGSDIAVILYTSGTTGASKGVMLSTRGCIDAASDTTRFDGLADHDVVFAYLPLAWVGDHYLNYVQGLVAGFCMACPESSETIEQDRREIGPTFYFAPPRGFEAMLTRLMIRMEDAAPVKRRMFNYFLDVARRYGEQVLTGKQVPLRGRLLYALGRLLVYEPLKNVLGLSRVRVAYTAGEAIGPDLFAFYRSIGLNLKQLYGQTEAFLYVTCQPDGEIYPDTVGPAAPNVDIRIAQSGEVQFRSPGMFVGYFKDQAKTAETMTFDGYVKTGDAGFFDEKTGHLKIIDRAKDVGWLADGTMVAPKYLENKLKFFPNIKEAITFGDSREFVCAMINIDPVAVANWAERNNIAYGSYQELAGHPLVYDMVAKDVAAVNHSLVKERVLAGAQIRRFLILHKELDADDGELTRTQKVRRRFIAERYAPLVTALYDGSHEADISTEVTFEDGRKGTIAARVKIRDMQATGSAESLGKAA
ncbi:MULTISPECIES: AMP-binding protein [Bradyrhizobium]|uniref:Long-chain fatty acid--CoA ligase n=1 Tax=Bradyrhizobium zhanjiangense TaxID=1325107 RepID=A0A4Q0SME8_9BRAD|nr:MULTISPECIES: AMP-binding protein [Bradyrhizobium]RXG91989.1 long-chain fatty acid--CoA ligase [Bradyrhizobium zhanjiangense]RXG96323.1 long-chain fatty acid--CoA ligase [Bradyrhizobium zhanjiangense]RXH39569.1 long-chain fatty acid--CoA ligase [Bradyrhizobium zhanjiangense]UQR61160.1 AMP-binding protein [Bradyrhizobium sp. C-145]